MTLPAIVGLVGTLVLVGAPAAQPERDGLRPEITVPGPGAPTADEPIEPAEPPDLADQVLAALDAPYLSDEERRDRRVFHGVWREGDLDTPQRRAAAALTRGTIDDESLSDPAVAAEDRAEAALLRGDLARAIEIVRDAGTLRALRIRAEALDALGRSDEAARALEPLFQRLRSERQDSAPELVEGVRGLMLRTQLIGPGPDASGDYQTMIGLLSRARSELDRLYWPAHLAEAELLYSHDNRKEAADAALQTLSMNPRCARAWALLGRAAVDSFNFDAAERIAARLARNAEPGVSLAGAAVTARARLRQNDPDGALEALRPCLDAFPRARALLALRAAAEAVRYDAPQVGAVLEQLDVLSPGWYDGPFEVGRALSEARQYEDSGRYLAEAARRAPFRAEPVIELGLMQMQAARDVDAQDTLARAVALDPFNTRAKNSLALVKQLLGYPTIESEHFIVRYKPGDDEVLAREMPDLLERLHARVTGTGPGGIDHQPADKTLIDLSPDHRAFAVRIAGITRIHTMAAATGPMIAMEAPREGAGHTVGEYDWVRVVRHEYTHTVTLSRTRNRIPHWFTEAAAVYLEDSPRDYRTCQLLEDALLNDGLFDLGEINLAFVRPRRPQDRGLAYAQGHWMYEYIVARWGERAPLDLMDRYAAGDREGAAFSAVLGLPPAKFLEEFRGWAYEQVEVWGMGRPAGRVTIAQLLTEEAAATPEGRADLASRLGSLTESGSWVIQLEGGIEPEWDGDLPEPTADMAARWLERVPDHPDVLEIAVRLALRENGGEASEEIVPLLERYAKARPVDPLPHKSLATLYLREQGMSDRAVPHLEWLDAREQNSSAYAAELARRYAAARDWPRALEKAKRATIVAPFDADYRELAATVALQAKEFATAERQVEALVRLEPDREIHQRRLEVVRRMRAQAEGSP